MKREKSGVEVFERWLSKAEPLDACACRNPPGRISLLGGLITNLVVACNCLKVLAFSGPLRVLYESVDPR